MRLVAHNGAPELGGAERATIRLLRGLSERGHDTLLLCNREAVRAEAERAGVRAALQRLGGDLMVTDAMGLARRLRRESPDVLLIATFRKLWLGALAGRWAGVPRVVARIGLETDTPRSFKYRFVLDRWIDAAVLNAESMRTRFRSGLNGNRPELVTIRTGMPPLPAPTEPGTVRRSLGIPRDAKVVGTVARIVEQKRLDRLLRVASLLPASVHVVVGGSGPDLDSLRDLGTELRLEDRVHWLGHRDDVEAVLDALDVFVLTSDCEGLSNAMIEALWAGVPVVSTRVSGSVEALEGPEAPGLVVGFRDEEIAAAVAALLEDRALRERASRAARRRAEERFGEEAMLAAWERVLSR